MSEIQDETPTLPPADDPAVAFNVFWSPSGQKLVARQFVDGAQAGPTRPATIEQWLLAEILKELRTLNVPEAL